MDFALQQYRLQKYGNFLTFSLRCLNKPIYCRIMSALCRYETTRQFPLPIIFSLLRSTLFRRDCILATLCFITWFTEDAAGFVHPNPSLAELLESGLGSIDLKYLFCKQIGIGGIS